MRRLVPVAPLAEEIVRAAKGKRARLELVERYAERFGERPDSVYRHLMRMLHHNKTITEETADRWCTFLGLHPDMLWPKDVAA